MKILRTNSFKKDFSQLCADVQILFNKKERAPKKRQEAYPDAGYSFITPGNYLDFVG